MKADPAVQRAEKRAAKAEAATPAPKRTRKPKAAPAAQTEADTAPVAEAVTA